MVVLIVAACGMREAVPRVGSHFPDWAGSRRQPKLSTPSLGPLTEEKSPSLDFDPSNVVGNGSPEE